MILYIDSGNTALKWRLVDAGRCVSIGRGLPAELFAELSVLCPSGGVCLTEVWLANVAGTDRSELLMQGLAIYVDAVHIVCVKPEQDLAGLHLAYPCIDKLGVDRWLLMLQLWHRRQGPFVVMSLGTAITLDRVAANGRHEGGLIAPGWPLLQQSLSLGTAGVRTDVGAFNVPAELGATTQACVQAGVAAMFRGFLSSAAEQFVPQNYALIVCGGDADLALPWLPSGAIHSPNLVLDGLQLLRELKSGLI